MSAAFSGLVPQRYPVRLRDLVEVGIAGAVTAFVPIRTVSKFVTSYSPTVLRKMEGERGFIPPSAKHLKGNRLSTSQSLHASY
jgi:hypothetical protein